MADKVERATAASTLASSRSSPAILRRSPPIQAALGAARRRRRAGRVGRLRADRHLRHAHRRRAFSSRRSAGLDRLQGARRSISPISPPKGRGAMSICCRWPAARDAAVLVRSLRLRSPRASGGDRHQLWSAATRRPRPVPLTITITALGLVAARPRRAAARRQAERPALCQRHHRRRLSRASPAQGARARPLLGPLGRGLRIPDRPLPASQAAHRAGDPAPQFRPRRHRRVGWAGGRHREARHHVSMPGR